MLTNHCNRSHACPAVLPSDREWSFTRVLPTVYCGAVSDGPDILGFASLRPRSADLDREQGRELRRALAFLTNDPEAGLRRAPTTEQ